MPLMTTNESSPLRGIALDLMALTGLPQTEIALRAQVHRPNLVSWLGGKDHVLSEQKQLAVCAALGWREGGLERESVHRWIVGEDFAPLKRMLEAEARRHAEIGFVQGEGRELGSGAAVLLADTRRVRSLILVHRLLAAEALPRIGAESIGVGRSLHSVLHVTREQKEKVWFGSASFEEALDSFPDDAFLDLLGAPTHTQPEEGSLLIDWDFELKMIAANWYEEDRDDWVALLSALQSSGLSPQAIARRIGVALSDRRAPRPKRGRFGQILEDE